MDEKVELVKKHRQRYGLNVCLQAVALSKGTWYYRQHRSPPEQRDQLLRQRLRDIIEDHPGYGYRPILAELNDGSSERVNHKRLRRILNTYELGLPHAGGTRKAHLIVLLDLGSRWVGGWAVGPSPNHLLALTALDRLIRRLVDELPEEKREAIRLFYDAQVNLRETAELLGVPEGTVKSRLYHGRRQLARAWTEKTKEK